MDERHLLHPTDVNGINKMAGEWYHILYNNVYGIRATCLRLTNTYGPRMRVKDARQTFLGIWLKQVLSGEPILVYGDGEQLRDFNYVDDVVDAMLLAALDPRADGQVYNLGSAELPISLVDLAQSVVEINARRRISPHSLSARSQNDRHRRLLRRLQQDPARTGLDAADSPGRGAAPVARLLPPYLPQYL